MESARGFIATARSWWFTICLASSIGFTPKFAKKYVNLSELILKALESYREEVLKGEFPTDQHSFHIDEKELSKVKG